MSSIEKYMFEMLIESYKELLKFIDVMFIVEDNKLKVDWYFKKEKMDNFSFEIDINIAYNVYDFLKNISKKSETK